MNILSLWCLSQTERISTVTGATFSFGTGTVTGDAAIAAGFTLFAYFTTPVGGHL